MLAVLPHTTCLSACAALKQQGDTSFDPYPMIAQHTADCQKDEVLTNLQRRLAAAAENDDMELFEDYVQSTARFLSNPITDALTFVRDEQQSDAQHRALIAAVNELLPQNQDHTERYSPDMGVAFGDANMVSETSSLIIVPRPSCIMQLGLDLTDQCLSEAETLFINSYRGLSHGHQCSPLFNSSSAGSAK